MLKASEEDGSFHFEEEMVVTELSRSHFKIGQRLGEATIFL
jgi:hypothetical protein